MSVKNLLGYILGALWMISSRKILTLKEIWSPQILLHLGLASERGVKCIFWYGTRFHSPSRPLHSSNDVSKDLRALHIVNGWEWKLPGTLVIQPLPSETVYTILTRRMHSSREGYTSSEGFTPASGGHNYRGDQTNSSYTFSVIWDTAVKLTVVRK